MRALNSASSFVSVLSFVTFALAGCGGGGGGGGSGNNEPPTSSPPPPAGPTADDISNAQNARVRMTLIGDELTMTWLDLFDDEQRYVVERRLPDGQWVPDQWFPPIDGGSGRWQRPRSGWTGSTYRVTAYFDGFSLPLHVVPGETEINVETRRDAQIQTDPILPGTGDIHISLSEVGSALSVTYYLDEVPLATSTAGDTFPATLPARHLVSGTTQMVVAEIQKSAGLTTQVVYGVFSDNPDPAVLLHVAPARALNNLLALSATASSQHGIASMTFFVNGTQVQVLDQPNGFGKWVHTLDMSTLPLGVNTFRAVATDTTGATVSMDSEYRVDRPSLTVEGPFDGMIASSGNVQLSSTFGADTPGTVLSVMLDDRDVARTRTSPFNIDFSLAGVAAGEHTLTVRAEATGGRVSTLSYRIIVPSTTRSYELIATDAEQLLSASKGTLLYRKLSGAVALRDASGVETQVQPPPGMDFSRLWLMSGYVVAQDRITKHMHALGAPGQSVDIQALSNGTMPRGPFVPAMHGHWLYWRWASTDLGFGMYYLPGNGIVNVTIPGMTQFFGSGDFINGPTNESVLFSGTVNGTRGIYRQYLYGGRPVERLLPGSYSDVRTDGTRMVMRDNLTISVARVFNTNGATTLSTDASDFYIEDGLISWRDGNYGVWLNDGSTTTQLSERAGVIPEDAIEDDRLIFGDTTGLYTWSAASGKQLVLDTFVPTKHTQGVAYLLTGSTGALYRTTLP